MILFLRTTTLNILQNALISDIYELNLRKQTLNYYEKKHGID